MLRKRLIVLLALIVLSLALCGCATVRYSVIISDYGARIIDYTVIFDNPQTIKSKEFVSVKTFFEFLKSKNDHSEVIYDESDPKQIVYRITYEDQEDYYISNGITGDEPNEPLEGKSEGLFTEYEVTLLEFDKADFMFYALTFLPYYDEALSDEIAVNIDLEKCDPDIKSILQQAKNNYNPERILLSFLQNEPTEIRAKLADEVEKILNNIGYDFSKIQVFIDYSHVYKSVYAKDADEVSTIETATGKQTMYTWKLDPINSNKITIYQKAPNVWIWELIAVIFGIVVAAACIVAFVLKRNKFNKQVASLTANVDGSDNNENKENNVDDINENN